MNQSVVINKEKIASVRKLQLARRSVKSARGVREMDEFGQLAKEARQKPVAFDIPFVREVDGHHSMNVGRKPVAFTIPK